MFTTDELTIIDMYSDGRLDRDNVLFALKDNIPYVDVKEIADVMDGIIRKLSAMTAHDFSHLDMSNVLEEKEE